VRVNDSYPRLGALRERLAQERVRGLVVSKASDQAWLTGFVGVLDDDPGTACLVGPHAARMFADSRYFEAARSAAEGGEWAVHLAPKPLDAAVETAAEDGELPLALQPELAWSVYERLARAFAGEIVPATGWVAKLREVKDAQEIERIERAQALTDRAFDHIIGILEPGMAELEVALELEVFMRRSGADAVAFPPIVASGPNSALPHAVPTGRLLAAADFVTLDFGAKVRGYCADMTRTVVLGTASERQRAIHAAVLEANDAGRAAVRPGAVGVQVHQAAVAVLDEHGMGALFGHGLGHGVGLDVHEGPRLGPASEDVLAPGMVVTVEPGVYEPGLGGARIEDLVVVDGQGHRVLTRSARELIEIRGR
jgi:Xaa-Pro aminopeptidase